ncbi:hypothetical protein [Niabella ginsengisoli]|uniref:Uncharacterized protein n=1 Tax=Niabella ginsengisoli TaxID=522298 RepID=A0ABS9SF87_9BACT|nr:hypothetical protein [Niabella ginsengisoli]MCH5597023.1 hypothetical protein [Niabella ginsengisoli]
MKEFIKGTTSVLFLLLALISNAQIPVPSQSQIAWQEAELGVVFHYDLHVFDKKNTIRKITEQAPLLITIFSIQKSWILINGYWQQKMPVQNSLFLQQHMKQVLLCIKAM